MASPDAGCGGVPGLVSRRVCLVRRNAGWDSGAAVAGARDALQGARLEVHRRPWAGTGRDLAAPAAAISYGVGRIGCLLAGDGDYGINTTLPWGVHMAKNALVPPIPATALVQPTPIYELLFSLAVFWLLWRLGERARPVGWLTGLYLLLSGIGRFLVEFVRINPKLYAHHTMSNAQVAAVASAIAGVIVLAVAQKMRVPWVPKPTAEPGS